MFAQIISGSTLLNINLTISNVYSNECRAREITMFCQCKRWPHFSQNFNCWPKSDIFDL